MLLLIDVPVGKKIEIDRTIYEYSGFNLDLGDGYNDWDWNDDWHNNYSWNSNVEYIMTNDGLKPTHQQEVKDEDYENQDEQSEPAEKPNIIDSSRYHYQPSNDSPGSAVKKTEVSIRSKSVIKKTVKITDITSSFFERLSL